jgi:hypothetical protein
LIYANEEWPCSKRAVFPLLYDRVFDVYTKGEGWQQYLTTYDNALFEKLRSARSSSFIQDGIASYEEQHRYAFEYPFSALPASHPVFAAANQEISLLIDAASVTQDFSRILKLAVRKGRDLTQRAQAIQKAVGGWEIAFDPSTGGISHLSYKQSVLADGVHQLGKLLYRTYGYAEIERFGDNYGYCSAPNYQARIEKCEWFALDFLHVSCRPCLFFFFFLCQCRLNE